MLVVVQELVTYSNGSYATPTRTLADYSLAELQQLTDDHAQSRSRRQLNEAGAVYIAANLSEFMAAFVLGDSNMYRGYFNYPLTRGVKYQVGYRATVPGTDTPLFLTPVGKLPWQQASILHHWQVSNLQSCQSYRFSPKG